MPTVLLLSPHLDDVAFSCGAVAFALAERGWTTRLCTVFTRSVPDPRGFALACQTDKGIDAAIDYMALRRDEDAAAGRCLNATELLWLDLPEAPHRGYDAAPALFGPFVAGDDVQPAVDAALAPLLAAADLVLAPQGIGDHVDHRRVRDAVLRLASAERVAWYRDTPYAIRHPEAAAPAAVRDGRSEAGVALGEAALVAKLDACAAYTTQLGFQFGGAEIMRATLAGFARSEAARTGTAAAGAEALWVPPGCMADLTA